ncbi:hypothetical protein [Globicatella sanguinis]|uniref:hypothetical protein n=1 Tax=Globicatella sanguinis TaxID=13076 RepID=UPI002543ECCD|nr:hypothetical protein [Globicatella sanguinis]MDK7631242.1 hypothetical protein [Globicatella sanguinis]WIK67140.1 hypothetical protein CYJ72_003345 [Globicatella sanguinis]WKT56545.1 hypothetical protein Q3C38_03345 [Globicatella sanguinis]
MTVSQLIIGWFYYGILYMGLSMMATVIINRVAKHYFTAPLVINAVAVSLLVVLLLLKQFTAEQFWFNLLFVYMPIVAASAIFNLGLFLIRTGKPLKEEIMPEE